MPNPHEYLELSIPRDPNARPAAVVFAMDPITKEYFPLTATDNGDGTYKLVVDATFGGSISIGDVVIKSAVGLGKALVTTDGKLLVYTDDSALQQSNMTSLYTYDGTDRVSTVKEYPTGAAGGSAAKLTTYTYKVGAPGDGKISSIVVTDTTV